MKLEGRQGWVTLQEVEGKCLWTSIAVKRQDNSYKGNHFIGDN